ncbi:spondin-2-like isoform X2 [Rhodnius prolixus]|uniref:spondin-2-like isoform X2 n=1 Tax=Rhodnius prolixus TaxID=13249 RepID=UPI003D18B8A4
MKRKRDKVELEMKRVGEIKAKINMRPTLLSNKPKTATTAAANIINQKMSAINNFIIFFSVYFSHFTISTAVFCRSNTLAVYSLKLYTFWNQKDFPKQYPLYRPPAQWSKLFGFTHDSKTILWREGELARIGIGQMAEYGVTDILEREINNGTILVFNEFKGLPITTGQGMTSSKIFADGNNTMVSFIMKIIPSPDWFIGLDSYDLCQHGHWINTAELKVNPMDAGTDDGFTFTSPNWKSEPLDKITTITNKQPNHPEKIFTLIEEDDNEINVPHFSTEHLDSNKAIAHKSYYVKTLKEKFGQLKTANKHKNRNFKRTALDCSSVNWNKFPACKMCRKLSLANKNKKVIILAKRRRKIFCSNNIVNEETTAPRM